MTGCVLPKAAEGRPEPDKIEDEFANQAITEIWHRRLRISIQRFPILLYVPLLLNVCITTVYRTFRLSLLGELPSNEGVNVATQMQWVRVMLEIVDEGLLLPLYYVIGTHEHDPVATKNHIITGTMVTLSVYVLFAILIAALAYPLVHAMGQADIQVEATVTYIRLEMIAIVFARGAQFLQIILTQLRLVRHLLIMLLVHTATNVVLDAFLLSNWTCSLKMGVNGIAVANIISSLFILAYASAALLFHFRDVAWVPTFGWLRVWSLTGVFSGLESLVRNLVYMLAILRMVNLLNEQATYYYAMELIWSWLLLLFTPLAELLKQDTAKAPALDHWHKVGCYGIYVAVLSVLWAISAPFWRSFIEHVLNAKDPDAVVALCYQLVPFYVCYMLTTLMNSVFYGKGKTDMLLVASIMTNLLMLIPFACILMQLEHLSLSNIGFISGGTLVLGFCITSGQYARLLRAERFRL